MKETNSLILIGGKSQRMGRDKATIERPDGTRQVDWLVRLAKLAGGEVFLSMRDASSPQLPRRRQNHQQSRAPGPCAVTMPIRSTE